MSDCRLYPVLGPLALPSSWSGVTWPTCDHQAPNSCRDCDGTRASGDDSHGVLPPCMRTPDNAEEAS